MTSNDIVKLTVLKQKGHKEENRAVSVYSYDQALVVSTLFTHGGHKEPSFVFEKNDC